MPSAPWMPTLVILDQLFKVRCFSVSDAAIDDLCSQPSLRHHRAAAQRRVPVIPIAGLTSPLMPFAPQMPTLVIYEQLVDVLCFSVGGITLDALFAIDDLAKSGV